MKSIETGLTTEEVITRQKQYGKNELLSQKKEPFLFRLLEILAEPMFILLIVAAVIYFFLGEPRDGSIMLIFVFTMIGIDVWQEWKTDKTLNALKDLSTPHCFVMRNGQKQEIYSKDLVPDDILFLEEGMKIPADGKLLRANDLCVDESSLTGEAEAVWKTLQVEETQDYWKKDYCYAGTLVLQGTATILVEKIGMQTEYGKIGKNIVEAPDRPTPLERQTSHLVKTCAMIAIILMLLVGVFTFLEMSGVPFKQRMIQSILSGITLAMAMIPEEFPVILTVFLSMGAWRLAKKNSLVHRLSSVETLGEISVLCVDKTGTITQNEMKVQEIWSQVEEKECLETMGLACEMETYDPMEKAMLTFCQSKQILKKNLFSGTLLKEFSFSNKQKRMAHIWQKGEEVILAAKGSLEGILSLCQMEEAERKKIQEKCEQMSKQGLRVIAVANQKLATKEAFPQELEQSHLRFCGLIGLQDPPRPEIEKDIQKCVKAGIRVVMITGDNGITASSIAQKIGIPNSQNSITGEQLDNMTEEELGQKIKTVNIFSRVIPEHKMKIVRAFQKSGEIVAMTGDGVNDAPALKYADIGIAMGKRGSEVSREAADLILMDDNFSTIVDTITDGRRIYDNIKKAIGYVFVIHIPIALSSLFSPMLGILPASAMLLPLHIVLLELMIDPTCSIVLERQPAEETIMERQPRAPKEPLLTKKLVGRSILQGMILFLASFGSYLFFMKQTGLPELARTVGVLVLLLSNLFLVQVNSSEETLAYHSIRKLAKDRVMWAVCILTIVLVIVITYTPINQLLKLVPLSLPQFLFTVILSIGCIFWYELVKLFRKKARKSRG